MNRLYYCITTIVMNISYLEKVNTFGQTNYKILTEFGTTSIIIVTTIPHSTYLK